MERNKDLNTRYCKSVANVNRAPTPSHPVKTSFWTKCSACQMKFEHLICYLNKRLRCRSPNCHKPYVATEIPPPPVDGNSSSDVRALSEAQSYPDSMRSNENALVRRQTSPTNVSSTGFSSVHLSNHLISAPASYSSPLGMLEPVVRHQKRGREEAVAVVKEKRSKTIQMSEKALSGSMSMSSDVKSVETEVIKKSWFGEGGVTEDAAFADSRALGTGSTSGSPRGQQEDRRRLDFSPINQFNYPRNLSLTETRKMLIHKAKKKILKKVHEWNSEKELADGLNSSQVKVKEKHGEVWKAPTSGTKAAKHGKPLDGKDRAHIQKTSHPIFDLETDEEKFVFKQFFIAKPDFHYFDNDRTEVSFADNQVWAAYDDEGMPRYYAFIHNVMTLKPFKMRISWLSSKSNHELGPMRWVGSGFAKTCGNLQIEESIIYGSINAFSHTMRWTKGTNGLIQIYPLKGDVWALYRNWSSDWNEFTPNEVLHSYDMVEVIEESSEDRGVTVAPLIKVWGFKTVFQKHSDPSKSWTISREEMFRFSHRIPAYFLTGEEGANAPTGCWELDPECTPLDLLEVVTQDQGGEMERPADTINEHLSTDSGKSKEKELPENRETGGKEMDFEMNDEANVATKGDESEASIQMQP